MTQPLALTLGDPAGVGPIIATRAWEQRDQLKRPFFLVGDVDQIRRAGGDATQIKSPSEAETVFERSIPVFHIPCSPTDAGRPNPQTAPAIISWIETAVAHVNAGEAAAVVTNPINKALLYDQGFDFPGHTEFLAHLLQGDAAAPQRPVMMLVGGGLRVALATIHMPLAGAAKRISRGLLVEIGQIVATDLRQNFGVAAPRLAFAGLNPHAGEGGALGREEIEIINPAAEALRSNGVNISDAQPGDTVFHHAREGAFDAVIAMYHDQGLIPVKTLDFWRGVNVTLGLPIIRTSPDHGTGYDAAAKGDARPGSLIAALNLASDMAERRSAA